MQVMSRIALYIRLSVEDAIKVDESESIINQRLYLQDYVKRNDEFNGMEVEEFIDDGYSGTHENRPSFQKMLNEVKMGNIQVIIVKDLSRFMRDYILLGDYLENIFPFLGIRFIAINDGYDSLKEKGNGTDLDIQFRGLLYDFYAKDISVKVKTVTTELKKQGKFLAWSPPLGYMRNPKDKYTIIVDKETAWIVKKIFSLALEGLSTWRIASIMNAENIPTPNKRKKELTNMDYDKTIILSETRKDSTWTNGTVSDILSNEIYTGTYVFNMIEKSLSKQECYVSKPKDKWGRVANNHEAIISKKDFEEVQKIKGKKVFLKGKNTDYPWRTKSPLQGFVKCPTCNHVLSLVQNKTSLVSGDIRIHRYFYCRICKCNNIRHKNSNVDILENIIFQRIREKYGIETDDCSRVNNCANLSNRLKKMKDKKLSNFEKYKNGILTKDQFLAIKQKIESELIDLEKEICRITREEVVYSCDSLNRELMDKYIKEVSCEANQIQKIVWK